MPDLTEQVDLIILGGGDAGADAAAALSRDGVSVMLCDQDTNSHGLTGQLLQPPNGTRTPCVARLVAGRGVRVERYER